MAGRAVRLYNSLTTPGSLPKDAGVQLERRSAARAKGDWTTSDRLREELAAKGVEVRDKPDGTFEAIVFRAAATIAADDSR